MLHCSPHRCSLHPRHLHSQSLRTCPRGMAQGTAPVPVLPAASPRSHPSHQAAETQGLPRHPRFTTVTSARGAVLVPGQPPRPNASPPLSPVASQRSGLEPAQERPVSELTAPSVHQKWLTIASWCWGGRDESSTARTVGIETSSQAPR